MELNEAKKIAEEVKQIVESATGAKLYLVGSIRRGSDVVKDIDFVTLEKYKEIVSLFIKDTFPNNRYKDMWIDVWYAEEDNLGAMIQYYTGSISHNLKLIKKAQALGFKYHRGIMRDKDGRRISFRAEKDLYEFLGERL